MIGPISGKPDIGGAAPARVGETYPTYPGGDGAPPGGNKTSRQELVDGVGERMP